MNNFNDRTKKMMFIMLGVIGIIVLIIIIALVVGKIMNSSLSYADIENKMSAAAKSYYSNRNNELPLNDSEEIEINLQTLVDNKLLKDVSKYQKDKNATCTGKVIVTKSGEYYNYSPYLDCGDKYTTTYFADELLKNVVNSGDGLYKFEQYDETKIKAANFIYRGEYPNNYVKFGNELWRVVKINSKHEAMLIESDYVFDTAVESPWDDRYNSDFKEYSGINVFYDSRIKQKLDSVYNGDTILTDNDKAKLVFKNACVNIRKSTDIKNDGSIECSKITNVPVKLSLLTTYDYINASLDNNCRAIVDKSCGNYNYLNKYDRSWWLLNTNIQSGYAASNYAYLMELPTSLFVRTVVVISKNVVYVSGGGTQTDPYIIK